MASETQPYKKVAASSSPSSPSSSPPGTISPQHEEADLNTMASHEPVQLSPTQWLSLALTFTGVVYRALKLTVTWSLERSRQAWPVSRRFAVAFIRQAGSLTHQQLRATTPPTGQQIEEYCEEHKLGLTSVELEAESGITAPATLHCINCQPDDETPILLFCHGGGYVNPIIKNGHIPFALHAAQLAKNVQERVALLEYTLAPALKYPGQLAQAVAALRLLLKSRKPNDIIIAGDSAGGNLILALLAHIRRPHPDISSLALPSSSKLRAVLLLSPWVSFETSAPSFTENTSTDYITMSGMGGFKDMWLPDKTHVWAQPLLGGSDFWQPAQLPVSRMLLTAGGWEVLRDQVLAMADMLSAVPLDQDSTAPVNFVLSAGEVHVQCVFDEAINIHGSHMATSVDDWLSLV